MPSTTIDLITENHKTKEFVLILIEDGPWPDDNSDWSGCLSRIQSRIYDAIDIAVDGQLASKYPDSKGKNVRVQIDSPHGAPPRLSQLITNLRDLIANDGNTYFLAIKKSPYIDGLCIAMGHELNPFN